MPNFTDSCFENSEVGEFRFHLQTQTHQFLFSLFPVALNTKPAAHLRPNRHPAVPATPWVPFLLCPPVALHNALGQDLKECKCFNVNRSPEINVLGLSCRADGVKSVIKLPLASTEAKSGQSREQVHLEMSPAKFSGCLQYMAALQPCLVAVCEVGLGSGFTLTCFFHIAAHRAEYYYRINKHFCRCKEKQPSK